MNQEEVTTTLSQIGKTSIAYCRFLVCNDQLIFCGGQGGTEVFNMSGEKIKILTKEYTVRAAVGKETFAAVMGQSTNTITMWSTKGDMAPLHSFQLAEGTYGRSIKVVAGTSNGAGDKVIINTWAPSLGNNIIVTEMGEAGAGEWNSKTLATFSEPATHYIAGQGNWIVIASFLWGKDSTDAIPVALWLRDKRLPDVTLPIPKRDGHRKILTGISIQSTIEGPKLVIIVDEVDDGECTRSHTRWEMMVYNMVLNNKTADEGINLDLIKHVVGSDFEDGSEAGRGELISTDLFIGYFSPGDTNSFAIIYEKKKMLYAHTVIENVGRRQIRLPYGQFDSEFNLNVRLRFNQTHIVYGEENIDGDYAFNICVKDFGIKVRI